MSTELDNLETLLGIFRGLESDGTPFKVTPHTLEILDAARERFEQLEEVAIAATGLMGSFAMFKAGHPEANRMTQAAFDVLTAALKELESGEELAGSQHNPAKGGRDAQSEQPEGSSENQSGTEGSVGTQG